MKHTKFRLDIIPPTTTAQQKAIIPYVKKNGKLGRIPFKPTKVKQMEALYANAIQPFSPATMFQGVIILKIGFFFPYKKTEKKSVLQLGVPYPKLTVPDADNMAKAFIDQMTKAKFWEDDSRVFSFPSKWYWSNPGVEVEIWALEELEKAWHTYYAIGQSNGLKQGEFSFIQ